MPKPPWAPLSVYHDSPEAIYVASETTPDKWYQVFWDGTKWKCTCKDYLKKRGRDECKHIKVYLQFLGNMEGGNEPEEVPERFCPPLPEATNGLAPSERYQPYFTKWIKNIHGRDFIQYEGLLAMAHEKGLEELGCGFISVTDTLAIAFAWAKFCSGRCFWDAGDATPNNVHPQVKVHFPRVALTRAKARVLRDALNIGMVSVEELAE